MQPASRREFLTASLRGVAASLAAGGLARAGAAEAPRGRSLNRRFR